MTRGLRGPWDDRKTQHLEGREYHVKFRDDEPAAAVAAAGAPPPVAGAESEFDRLVRIGCATWPASSYELILRRTANGHRDHRR